LAFIDLEKEYTVKKENLESIIQGKRIQGLSEKTKNIYDKCKNSMEKKCESFKIYIKGLDRAMFYLLRCSTW
jgi:hypothetical protein